MFHYTAALLVVVAVGCSDTYVYRHTAPPPANTNSCVVRGDNRTGRPAHCDSDSHGGAAGHECSGTGAMQRSTRLQDRWAVPLARWPVHSAVV